MADGIIDLTRYLKDGSDGEPPKGSFALWGADGERSRFALPLWRMIYLAQGDRGVIVYRDATRVESPKPFVALDLGSDPARLELVPGVVPSREVGEPPTLHDREAEGLVIYLGSRDDRLWHLVVDGGDAQRDALVPRAREDILFLAGECAGLLFLRDFADEAD